jgi:hypothetical protein
MQINVTSTDQTFDISISDGGASVILGDKGIGSRKRLGGRDVISRRKILQGVSPLDELISSWGKRFSKYV